MTPERWRQVMAIFDAAIQREQAEQAAFLADACGGDDRLCREVQSLLVAHRDAAGFGSTPLLLSSSQIQLGSSFGPYRIESLLGGGGMGEVYRATDMNLKRQVAIKVLHASVACDTPSLTRFQREAEVLAALNHPNIAHIHGLEKADG